TLKRTADDGKPRTSEAAQRAALPKAPGLIIPTPYDFGASPAPPAAQTPPRGAVPAPVSSGSLGRGTAPALGGPDSGPDVALPPLVPSKPPPLPGTRPSKGPPPLPPQARASKGPPPLPASASVRPPPFPGAASPQ